MEKTFIKLDNTLLLPNFKRITLTLAIIVLVSFSILAQTAASRQTARPKGTTGAYYGFYEYLPSNYASASNLPVVIFFHGIGEAGNGTTDLSKVLRNGPPKEVQNGKDYPFILISPQHNDGWWNNAGVEAMLTHIKKNYKVDVDRIYVTGLSAGGYGTWTAGQGFASQLAAIVPVCGCGNSAQASNMVNLPIWAFHNSNDPTVNSICSTTMVDAVKKAGGSPKLTMYQSSSHDAWTATYKNQEMWDWLLAQKRGGSTTQPAPNKAPIANAGSDVSITLPTNSVALKGTASDSDGSISKYVWTKTSGPSATLTNANTATLTASNLVAGNYVFRLTATDNASATGYDEVTVAVGEATGVNLALKKPATVSSLENTNYSASFAVDGKTSSRWSSAYSDNQWIYVDLGSTYNIERVKIAWEVAYGKDYQIQISSNATNWETIKTVSGNTSLNNDFSGLSGSGRYVRILATQRGTRYGYSIFEFQVFGSAGNASPIANAGSDVSITLPSNSVTLKGSATDSDGTISKYSWTKQSGPNATLTNSSTATLTASGLLEGTYVFRLTSTDNNDATGYDDVVVKVNPAAVSNSAPVLASIGNKTLKGGSSLTLSLSATDADKDPIIFTVSGLPAFGLFKDNTNGTATLTFTPSNSTSGLFNITITATDSKGNKDTETIVLTVTETIISEPVQTVVYRINAGGEEVKDTPMNWSADNSKNPSKYLLASNYNTEGGCWWTKTNTTDAPTCIFGSFRTSSDKRGIRYGFPVENGSYMINLYFAQKDNSFWAGTQKPGDHLFDVLAEGTVVINDLDLYVENGYNSVKTSVTVSVTDGILNLDLLDVRGYPQVNGIEILSVAGNTNVAARTVPNESNSEVSTDIGDVLAFPNPITDANIISLEFSDGIEGNITISLMDQIGTTYLTRNDFLGNPSMKYEVDLSGVKLTSGIYFLKISNENKKDKVIKIIKQ